MSKTNLKDATKDLLQSSESVMESVADVRKGADVLMHMLRKLENQYLREEEIRREEEMLAEQERLAQSHTKAYTMPDSEEEAAACAAGGKTARATPSRNRSKPVKGGRSASCGTAVPDTVKEDRRNQRGKRDKRDKRDGENSLRLKQAVKPVKGRLKRPRQQSLPQKRQPPAPTKAVPPTKAAPATRAVWLAAANPQPP